MRYLFLLFVYPVLFAQQSYRDVVPFSDEFVFQSNSEQFEAMLANAEFYVLRDYNRSFYYIQEADSLFVATQFTKLQQAGIDYALAEYYYEKGDFSKTMNELTKAIGVFENENEAKKLRKAKNLLAKIERENDNFYQGIVICQGLIKEAQAANSLDEVAMYQLNIANIYLNVGTAEAFNKARKNLNRALDYYKQNGLETGSAMAQVKLARYYKIKFLKSKALGDYDIALRYSQSALEIFDKRHQAGNKAYAFYTMATTHSIAGRHQESIPVYEQSLEEYRSIGNLIYQLRINQHLFVAHSILGNQEKALTTNKTYVKLKDSIFSIEKRQLLTDAQIKFETQKVIKEKEIAELQSSKNRSLFIGAIFIAGLILLSSLFYFGRMRAKKRAELIAIELKETQKRLTIEKQYRDSELKALKAQMNPHFIFNALNSIQDYIVLNQKNLASDYLGKFADLIRNYLHYSDIGYISVPEEIENLKRYLDLEKLRFEEDLKYSFEIEEEVNSDVYKIPTMLIQPYIENALKHGLLHKKEDKQLYITLSRKQEKRLTCVIVDNGIGRVRSREINAQRNKAHKSFALKANTERLDLLNYGKSRKIGVEIVDLKNEEQILGTKVILHIPILTK